MIQEHRELSLDKVDCLVRPKHNGHEWKSALIAGDWKEKLTVLATSWDFIDSFPSKEKVLRKCRIRKCDQNSGFSSGKWYYHSPTVRQSTIFLRFCLRKQVGDFLRNTILEKCRFIVLRKRVMIVIEWQRWEEEQMNGNTDNGIEVKVSEFDKVTDILPVQFHWCENQWR
jgi:hypothetical protein